MAAKIIGLERLDYFSKKSQKQVRGYKFHLSEPLTKAETVGVQVFSEFLHDENAPDFTPADFKQYIGRDVRFFYNRYGTADGISLLPQGKG